MAYENEGPFTLTSGEALVADRLVLLSSSTAKYADGGEEPIGLTDEHVATATPVTIKPLRGGLMKVTGSKAISAGAAIYVTTDGKVSDAAVGKQIGILHTAITGDGGKGTAIVWGPRGGNDLFAVGRKNVSEFWDDFFEYDPTATVGNWAVVEDASAAVGDALTDAVNGVLNVGPDGDDDDECYVSSIAEIAKCQTNKKFYFETKVKLTEGNTDDANVVIGLSDTVSADFLQAAGAGPAASYDGIVIFKVDGGTVWQAETSNAGTQDTDTDIGAVASGVWVTWGILYDYLDGTTGAAYIYKDGVLVATLDVTISGMDEMHIVFGVKQGGTGTEESLLVDYACLLQER